MWAPQCCVHKHCCVSLGMSLDHLQHSVPTILSLPNCNDDILVRIFWHCSIAEARSYSISFRCALVEARFCSLFYTTAMSPRRDSVLFSRHCYLVKASFCSISFTIVKSRRGKIMFKNFCHCDVVEFRFFSESCQNYIARNSQGFPMFLALQNWSRVFHSVISLLQHRTGEMQFYISSKECRRDCDILT